MKILALLVVVAGLFAAAYAQPLDPLEVTANIIWIDYFENELNTPSFKLNVSCGLPSGDLCNTNAVIEATATQSGPWPLGRAPIGGERFHYLSIDSKNLNYVAGKTDNIEVTYDQVGRVRMATSPGIGGTYMLLWNGPGNNVLPCHSVLGARCALDQACCNTGNPAAGAILGTGPGNTLDLTAKGTQFGVGLYQKTADHDSPIIMRVWGADGRSVVLRKAFEADFLQRNILFLYKDFVPFPGDANLLRPDQVMGVLQNAKAVAFEIFGAIALDAKMTFIRTVGLFLSKNVDPEYLNKTLRAGDRICYSVYLFNTAPVSMNVPGTDQSNLFILNDVDFTDNAFIGSPLAFDRTSLQVITVPGMTYNTYPNDAQPDKVHVTFLDPFYPMDNATIKFCGVVRTNYKSDFCLGEFCNTANVYLPGWANEIIPTERQCNPVKFDTSLGLSLDCPVIPSSGEIPRITINYLNRGPAPALNAMVTLTLSGVPPNGLSDPSNIGWTCLPDPRSPLNTLLCTYSLGDLAAGTAGSLQFRLNVVGLTCNYTNLHVLARIDEHCSNATNSTQCDIPIPHNVNFSITKTFSLPAGVPAVPGQRITYTISFRNVGSTPVDNVVVTEMYPEFTTPLDNPGWVCDTTLRRCTYFVGTVLPNSPLRSIQFNLKLADSLPEGLVQLCNTATISNTASEVPGRCEFSNSTQACLPVSTGIPDTGVIKEGRVARLIYRLTYYNNGTADASSVVITENIPVGTTFDPTLSDPRWVCIGDVCTIHLEKLKMGASETALFVVNTVPDFNAPPTCWLNRATISHVSEIPDQSPGDNQATFSVGACGGNIPVVCPDPCAACPICNCTFPECRCPEPICKCGEPKCNCPDPKCICREPICKCPTFPPMQCPKCNCNCPAKCPKLVEECGCKEIININLPCGLPCPTDRCGSEESSSYEIPVPL